MCSSIVDDIADALFDEEAGFFGEEAERETEENVLLRGLGERADQDAGSGEVAAEVRNVVDVVEVVAMGETGEGDGVGYVGVI